MKTKRQNHHRGWKQALSVLLVFALVAGLVLSMPALSGVAYAAPVLQDEIGTEEPAEDGELPLDDNTPDTGDSESATGSGEQSTGNAVHITGNAAGAAEKLNWEKKCNVTVAFPTDMVGCTSIDLEANDVAADLYLFAPAVRLSGYDVYAYCVDDSMPYYEVVKNYLINTSGWHTEKESTTAPTGYTSKGNAKHYLVFRYSPEDLNTADVREQEGLAELMAKVLLAPEMAGLSADQVKQAKTITPAGSDIIDVKQTDLSAGLYLNVVRDAKTFVQPKDYIVLVEQTNADGTPAEPKVCTIAYSDTKVYTFQPQLLSLPTRDNLNTTADGTWYYDLTVAAKGSADIRYADLQIQKSLANGNTVADGTTAFVFEVKAFDEKDQEVYHETITLRNDSEGGLVSKEITNKIPVGSRVEITEVYSGVGYEFDAESVKIAVSANDSNQYSGPDAPAVTSETKGKTITIYDIPAGRLHLTTPTEKDHVLTDGTIEKVSVTNKPDNTNNGGGTVVNSFTQNDTNDGWTWTKRSYDPETGKWVSSEGEPVTNTEEG